MNKSVERLGRDIERSRGQHLILSRIADQQMLRLLLAAGLRCSKQLCGLLAAAERTWRRHVLKLGSRHNLLVQISDPARLRAA